MISFPPKEESLGKTYRAFWWRNKFLNQISIPLAWKRWVRMLGVQPRVSCRSSQHRAGTEYSCPLVSTGDWFQDPHRYPSLQMFKAPNEPSVSTGSASADSNTTEMVGWIFGCRSSESSDQKANCMHSDFASNIHYLSLVSLNPHNDSIELLSLLLLKTLQINKTRFKEKELSNQGTLLTCTSRARIRIQVQLALKKHLLCFCFFKTPRVCCTVF